VGSYFGEIKDLIILVNLWILGISPFSREAKKQSKALNLIVFSKG
jgi:hypothetical protein